MEAPPLDGSERVLSNKWHQKAGWCGYRRPFHAQLSNTAAFIGAYVPPARVPRLFRAGFLGVALTLLIATVIEVCSEGSSPIAFEIHANLGVLENPFVFLMASVATDHTEVDLIWTNTGRRTALWLPAIAVPHIVVVGLALNALSVS